MTGEFYLVRLHGSCTELKVHEDNMRICQSWLNGQWIISPKGPAKSGVVNFSRNLISNNYKAMPEVQHTKDVCSPGLD
ncbi:RNA binding protein, partial [Trifolium medium]|nr:RNA binding protein [Trifolium medium]